jgi:hypothetical protein
MHEQRAGRRLPSRRAVHVELPGASTGGGPHRVLRTTPDPRHERCPRIDQPSLVALRGCKGDLLHQSLEDNGIVASRQVLEGLVP